MITATPLIRSGATHGMKSTTTTMMAENTLMKD
jgi:hypothetical protein